MEAMLRDLDDFAAEAGMPVAEWVDRQLAKQENSGAVDDWYHELLLEKQRRLF